jgi:hypothetical protein
VTNNNLKNDRDNGCCCQDDGLCPKEYHGDGRSGYVVFSFSYLIGDDDDDGAMEVCSRKKADVSFY